MDLSLDHLLGTAISFGLVLFFIYRRLRRNFGRQKLGRSRLKFRLWVLGILGLLLVVPAFFSPLRALATLVGGGIGVGLAIWAAKHTRFEKQDDTLYYIPHTYTGMVVTALFLGRLLYRLVAVSHSAFSVAMMDTGGASPGDFGGFSAISSNPLTRIIFFILVGYYCYYYWYVLHESEHLKPEDWEQQAPPPPSPSVGGNVQ
ncbi:MAG TPA: hypothetical protein VFV77_01885 [Gammaproteobacteria bacterium]|nr:hypothetical protein [Gammaproteobacteria bacterium]